MKTSWLTIVLLVFAASRIQGQVSQSGPLASAGQGTIQAQDTPYAVVSKGANQQVWQKTTYETAPSGQTVPHLHQYTELATGLHYWNNGQWVDSKEEIDIMPNGTAAATNGQHQVYFPGDIYAGVIELVTPDGKYLRSRPLGLSYDDGTNTVLIAELTNSVGYLVGSNQVIYPDAFDGLQADLCYTYTKAGFEQDIILREQPLTPESYGLNPVTTRLQVLSEFFNPPTPTITAQAIPTVAGNLEDDNLNFGVMQMTPGKAFLLGTNSPSAQVAKQWLNVGGRQLLVEEVPVPAIADELLQLPPPPATSVKLNPPLHVVSAKRLLPPQHLAKGGHKTPFISQATPLARGLVLDYQTINSSLTNYTFRGDTTYYISGTVYLNGTNTIEGGAVLKYGHGASVNLMYTFSGIPTLLNWLSTAYNPVIFTSIYDNSVGETISGSSNLRSANPVLSYPFCVPTILTLGHFRMANFQTGLVFNASNQKIVVNDAQFVNGNCAVSGASLSGPIVIQNALFTNLTTGIQLNQAAVVAENATFSGISYLTSPANSYVTWLYLTNCILANVTSLYSSPPYLLTGSHNGFYKSPVLGDNQITNTFYPFQTAGAGNFYLANGCAFTNACTTNIDPALLTDLAIKTTHPPIVYSNVTYSVSTNFLPQAPRDTNNFPDLGYHYDPIDYIVDNCTVTNATLTIAAGTVLATYNEAGLKLADGSSIISTGTVTAPNYFTRYQAVQEQSISLGGTNISSGMDVMPAYNSVAPSGSYQFSKFTCPAGGGVHLYDVAGSSYSNLTVQECEFWSGANTLGGTNGTVLTLMNNLFARSVINASGNGSLSLSNTLAWGVLSVQLNPSSTNAWYAFNNDFDSCSITNSTLTNGYNAYLNCSGRLYPTNAYDVVSNATLAYQTGFLGTFYQPTNSPLIDAGSTNANLVGLYHYTTQTNQVKEANSIVDIGYHYVAVDTNGIPTDTNGDGIPDYLEDANGNGLVDNGETNWALAILTQPVSQVVPQGTNVTFAVTAGGIAPLSYQWCLNGTNVLGGATNTSLTLTNVQTTNAGNYSVVVTNVAGSVTSSNAVLTVNVPPVITMQPTNQTGIQGSNVTFSVTVTGTLPLSCQWYFNGTNLLAGATNASLTLEDVQTTDAGGYSVVITNAAGSATSSNATLTVMSWTVDSDYDGVSDAQEIVDGTDPFNPDSVLPIRLGYWRFDDTNTWVGDAGQLPLLATNVVGVPSWNTNAALIDSTNPAILTYRDVETNGNANINLRQGTIRFWFKPDWSSADWIGHYGTGPGSNGRLIEVGNYNPAFTNGWWALYLSPDGTQLTFGSSTNGAGNTNLSTNVSWALKHWHQIVLTYSPTNSTLYWDGQEIATDETGPNYYPSLTERANGFRIGSDAYGGNQAGGVFDELETFNYQLTATDIANDYDYATVTLPRPPTVTITSPTGDSTNFVGTSQSLMITVDAQAASGHSVQEVDYSYNEHVQGDPPIGISTQSPYFPITWINTDWINAFVGAYDITAIAIDDRGVASDPATASDVTIMLDSDGDGIPDWWMLQYFGHPTGEAGDNSLAGADADGDGVSNLKEFQNGTDPIVMPVLEILSGNNQGGNYDSFLPLPITIEVTGMDSVVFTNAPVVFTVTNGTALLALTTTDTPTNTLSFRTDSNGQASVWVYFPPSGSNPPDSTILISASSGINSATVIANEYVLLAHWRFDDTNTWVGEAGQLPLLTNNLVGVPSWSSNAVVVDSTSPALLTYRVVEASDNTNINCETGSVLFYFKPDWSSADEDQGGTGPGTSGRLIEMGSYNPAFTNGWWSLYLSPDGTQLLFATSTNGGGMTNLTANISWASNTWYQIALAYSPDGSALFVDGQLATNGAGVVYLPNADELANGFRIGSDQDGNNQAAGTFDELETFASPLNGGIAPTETYWFGIPDYKADPNGMLGAWEMSYFGHIGLDPNGDYDNDGTNNLQEFMNGADPNKISFSFSVANQYVTTNVVSGLITILGGVPSSIAVLVDNTNFAGAMWTAYTSSNVTVNLGATDCSHDVWIGLRGLPANAQQTWEETTLVLDSTSPTISITNPVDGTSLNASRVNVCGNFTAASLKQITVNDITAFANGANFEALNVPLAAGPNTITAVIEDLTGVTNAFSINVVGITNSDGSMNEPVQLQATPVAGFAPLPVTFQVQANVPGTIQQVFYDFNGDDIADFVTNSLDSITYTYQTNGEYFPVVTIQTDAGRFSSIGGWNAVALDPSNQPIRINVQAPATQSTFASITDPVDLKWDGTHLYVLSGSGAAIYEFATNGTTIASLPLGGGSPSGIDVDAAGNVYVAVTSSNQVWKFSPTNSSFIADTNFGIGGFIGITNGISGTNNGEFNTPFDVAVSPDGGAISVSDSGNNRIQQFSAMNGAFIASFGSQGNGVGQFNTPEGLTYDSSGILYITDSGNNRIVMAEGSSVMDATGTGGTDLGQFSSPVNISVGERGVYVADTGNNRIQKFDLSPPNQFSITPSSIGYAISTNLSAPAAVAAVDDPTTDIFYVADTGNNRIVLYSLTADDPTPAWTGMTAHVAAGDIPGAMQYFSCVTANDYIQDFLAIGTANVIPAINQIGTLTPAYINGDEAEYYFQQTINGQVLTFKVEFVKENGVWKIFEF